MTERPTDILKASRVSPAAARPRLLIPGFALILVAIVGFLVVADDTRHSGETLGVVAILISGLAFVGAARSWLASLANLAWLPVGLLLGVVGGATFDAMGWGLLTGLLVGIGLAGVNRTSYS